MLFENWHERELTDVAKRPRRNRYVVIEIGHVFQRSETPNASLCLYAGSNTLDDPPQVNAVCDPLQCRGVSSEFGQAKIRGGN